MIKRILLVVLLALVGFCGYVALQPAEFTVSREVLINASPERVFGFLNSPKNADDWMPWKEIDPQVKTTYIGPEFGVGAISSWESPGDMGKGRAEIVESVPNVRVRTQLTYTEPMVMSQLAEIALRPGGNGTIVKWSVSGDRGFLPRLICFVLGMEKQIGGYFERGLATLKSKAESAP